MRALAAVSGRYEYTGIDEEQGESDGGGFPSGRHHSPLAMDIEGLRLTRLSTADERIQWIFFRQTSG